MTDQLTRLYALVVGVVVFFVAWAAIAAHPWTTPKPKVDPRIAALAAREKRIHRESVHVKRVLDRRWAVYHKRLHARQHQIAAVQAKNRQIAATPVSSPSVRVVTLPPLTITRTS